MKNITFMDFYLPGQVVVGWFTEDVSIKLAERVFVLS